MRRSLAWMTATLVVVAVTAVVAFRPVPLPAAPPPIRLEGEVETNGPLDGSLQVVPPGTVWLGPPDAGASSSGTGDTDSSFDSPVPVDSVDTASIDSVDSPDD